MARYNVVSIDNETIARGGRAESRGEFESGEAAIDRAKQLVDTALLEHFAAASTVHELMAKYMREGSEVPMIYGEPRLEFHAYRYAREKATALFAQRPPQDRES
jgi:hypothetical protein